jgi:hypothetical protein
MMAKGRKALQGVAFASDRSRVRKRSLEIQTLGGRVSMRSGVRWALLITATALLLTSCAAGPNELVDTGPDPAGFWLGLWQGLISPITFIVSLFTPNVNIYEVQNNGNWYDFGFMLGVACAFGSGGWGGTSGVRRTRNR